MVFVILNPFTHIMNMMKY